MIRSMTGHGAASCEHEGMHLAVELRSVNNRSFKAMLRLPDSLGSLEGELESWLARRIGSADDADPDSGEPACGCAAGAGRAVRRACTCAVRRACTCARRRACTCSGAGRRSCSCRARHGSQGLRQANDR